MTVLKYLRGAKGALLLGFRHPPVTGLCLVKAVAADIERENGMNVCYG